VAAAAEAAKATAGSEATADGLDDGTGGLGRRCVGLFSATRTAAALLWLLVQVQMCWCWSWNVAHFHRPHHFTVTLTPSFIRAGITALEQPNMSGPRWNLQPVVYNICWHHPVIIPSMLSFCLQEWHCHFELYFWHWIDYGTHILADVIGTEY
jgi:hypothetical protein